MATIPWHWALNENVRRVSGIGLAGLMASMLLLAFLDRRRRRQLGGPPADDGADSLL